MEHGEAVGLPQFPQTAFSHMMGVVLEVVVVVGEEGVVEMDED